MVIPGDAPLSINLKRQRFVPTPIDDAVAQEETVAMARKIASAWHPDFQARMSPRPPRAHNAGSGKAC